LECVWENDMRILALSVHPDDETLGCGGTLLRQAAAGDTLHWLIMTAACSPEYSEPQIAQQTAQIEAVRQAYPFTTLHWLKFPTARLELQPLSELVQGIRRVIEKVRPDTVFIPNRSDVHSDHRITFQAAAGALKGFYLPSWGIHRVLACEVPSETDAAPPLGESAFLPTVFVDIGTLLDRKIEIMGLYVTEVQTGALPRTPSTIRALARVRGATIGVEYAEAFMLIRECC
jgi:LmbE family N-acetylglucosaminyl deacetylase